MTKHFDPWSIVVIILTLVLFGVALFEKGFTHDMLLEAGRFSGLSKADPYEPQEQCSGLQDGRASAANPGNALPKRAKAHAASGS